MNRGKKPGKEKDKPQNYLGFKWYEKSSSTLNGSTNKKISTPFSLLGGALTEDGLALMPIIHLWGY